MYVIMLKFCSWLREKKHNVVVVVVVAHIYVICTKDNDKDSSI